MAKIFNGPNPMKGQDEDKPELDPARALGEQATERMVGKLNIPDDGIERIKPLPLAVITPDPAQPRKIVPVQVIKAAAQDSIPVWQAWHRIAEQMQGEPINLKAILKGDSDGFEGDPKHAIVKGFMGIVGLAADIARIGQTNAVTVVRVPGTVERYKLETGERRWLAHQMLYAVLGKEKFNKIKARIVEGFSIWRQASENGARDKLTAVAKARQIALLLMDWYHEHKGIEFTLYHEMVTSIDVCDRVFYAQAKPYKVPDGQGEIFLQAVDLPSKTQLSRYRALLEIPDELWVRADEEDMAERRIREEMDQPWLPMGNHESPDRFTGREPMASNLPMSIKPGEGPGTMSDPKNHQLLDGRETVEYINSQARKSGGLDVLIFHLDPQGRRTWAETVRGSALTDLPHPERGKPTGGINYDALPQPAYTPRENVQLAVGQLRRNHQGKTFKVLSVLNGLCSVEEISPSTGNPLSTFSMHATAVGGMTLVDTDDLSAVREAIMGPDDETPPGGWQVGLQVVYEDSERRVEGTIVWTDGRAANIELKGKKGERRQVPVKGLRLAEGDEVDQSRALDMEHDLLNGDTEDNPHSNRHELPDWATRGATIHHLPTATLYDVVGTAWDDLENQWYVRVQFAEGAWKDLPVNECEPYTEHAPLEEAAVPAPVPFERHAALNPHNASSVITQDQYKLGPLWHIATEYKMQAQASMISRMKVLTPNALDAFLRDKGEEGAYAELEAMWRACDAVKQAIEVAMNAVYNEAAEVLRQKIAEKAARP